MVTDPLALPALNYKGFRITNAPRAMTRITITTAAIIKARDFVDFGLNSGTG